MILRYSRRVVSVFFCFANYGLQVASKTVFDYLMQQNRPYNAGDIFTNLKESVGKAVLLRVLESLVESGDIKVKEYGKQKIYCADQSKLPKVDTKELDRMDVVPVILRLIFLIFFRICI